jgi:hypothetical protein
MSSVARQLAQWRWISFVSASGPRPDAHLAYKRRLAKLLNVLAGFLIWTSVASGRVGESATKIVQNADPS